ncbi:MAG: methyltransferase domain-containing protein, partial [Bacteroidetes bacterium]|nr:methyltransferase domain-containing protein [Bacteroidota bacterium]
PVLALNIVGIIINIVLNYFLIPGLGIKGALIGSVAAQWVILCIYEYYRRKILRPYPPALSLTEMKQREHILCPVCHSPLSLDNHNCQNGHIFSQEHGVIQLFTPEEKAHFVPYLQKFDQYREKAGWHITDPTIFPRLPFISEATALGHWKPKQHDLRLIKRLLKGKKNQKILEIGAWNGWLSHHLVKWGHSLTTIDYFDSEYDGLKAMKYYPQKWIALQMEVEDISVLAGQYDVIILNRCYAYYTDPIGSFQQLREKLAPEGMMILTGLNIYTDGDRREAEFEAYKENFLQENGFEMMSKPTKGFLDLGDKSALEEEGVRLFIYRRMIRHRVKSALLTGVSRLYWGVFRKNE